jgi:hypothetical protein
MWKLPPPTLDPSYSANPETQKSRNPECPAIREPIPLKTASTVDPTKKQKKTSKQQPYILAVEG